jgi:putative intracellular protease/amidase
MRRADDEREFRLRPPKPRAARNEGAAWSSGFRLLMHYARSTRKTGNRAPGGKGKGPRPYHQRCAIRVTYLKNKTRGQWKAHGRYLARESATFKNDAEAVGFSWGNEAADIARQLENWQGAGDQQIWKVIVSPEFGDRVDLSRLTRDLGNTGRKTGFWLEEFAAPYFVFRDAGVDLTLASLKGGQPPIDPKSDLPEGQTPAMTRFKQDAAAQKARSKTRQLSDMKSEDFDTIFYVGGHGPMWDLVDNPVSIRLIESFYNSGEPVAAVCHSPAVFHRVMYQGELLIKGKRVTGFTNGEEAAVNLTHVVPFLVEDELKRIGGLYEKAADWESFALVDGRVVTGQNPASSTAAAKVLMELLSARKAA